MDEKWLVQLIKNLKITLISSRFYNFVTFINSILLYDYLHLL